MHAKHFLIIIISFDLIGMYGAFVDAKLQTIDLFHLNFFFQWKKKSVSIFSTSACEPCLFNTCNKLTTVRPPIIIEEEKRERKIWRDGERKKRNTTVGNFSKRKTARALHWATAKQLTFESFKHVCAGQHYEFRFSTCFELQINVYAWNVYCPRANIQCAVDARPLFSGIDFLLWKRMNIECSHQLCSKCHGFITSIWEGDQEREREREKNNSNKLRAHVQIF